MSGVNTKRVNGLESLNVCLHPDRINTPLVIGEFLNRTIIVLPQ